MRPIVPGFLCFALIYLWAIDNCCLVQSIWALIAISNIHMRGIWSLWRRFDRAECSFGARRDDKSNCRLEGMVAQVSSVHLDIADGLIQKR